MELCSQTADHFGKQHKHVIENIEKLLERNEKIGRNLVRSFYFDSYNRKQKKYLLNRDAFVFVVQKFSGKKAHQWQWKYIDAFNKMESIIREKQSTDWQLIRKNGKMVRMSETDAIAIFIKYAEKQGGENGGHYYRHFTDFIHSALGIKSGEREMLTPTIMECSIKNYKYSRRV